MRRSAVAAFFVCALLPSTAMAEGERVAVALAAGDEQEPICRSLEAELGSIGVDARLLVAGEPAEQAARASGATVLVLCEADPARIVIRFLDGSWPTDPAYIIAIGDAAAEAAVLDTSEWLRARLVAPPAPPAPPAEEAPVDAPDPPLPPWQRPYVFAGALHDQLVQSSFLRPFVALGAGFFPMTGLHLFGQLSAQAYRLEMRASGISYRLSADHGQVGIGYLQPIKRGHVGVVLDARFGVLRVRARGENGPGIRGQDEVVWNPLFMLGGGFFARTRGPVAFRATVAYRTQFSQIRIYLADELLRTVEAHDYAFQWQMEVSL